VRLAGALMLTGGLLAGAAAQTAPFRVVGDAIPDSLTGAAGDAARGRSLVADRQTGACLLCHKAPIAEEPHQGDLAPDLAGAGARWSVGQLRLRVVDAARLNPATIMPPYHRAEGLTRVAPALRGRPMLDAAQVEDVVAWLASLDGPR
jgi:sulfur-oxidizing protein SoxX